MPDIKNDIGAREVEALERRCLLEMSYEYGQASREMENKLRYYLQKFAAEDALERQKLEAGQITQKEYGKWRQRKMLLTSGWRNMRDILTEDAVNADMIAASIIKGYMPEAYAIGFNYSTYMIEKTGHIDTNFILYDKSTVERLWRKYPKLMPDPAPNSRTAKLLKVQKDMRWNRGHIQSAVTQSILQGESLNETARRLQHVVEMDNNVAKRSAATMLTSAHNGGRQDSYMRAEALGLDMVKTWIATIDGHIRDAHRDLDGQHVKPGEPFKSILGDIMFPGDPNADPANVYNCRCKIGEEVRGFESDPADLSVRPHDIGDMTYEEWKAAKGNETPFKAARNYDTDEEQLKAYKKLGVKGLPSNTRDFQNIKYYDPKAYSEIKEQARALRSGREYIPNAETSVVETPVEVAANIHAEFVPANTISDAEGFARSTFVEAGGFKLIGKDVSYKGIDVEMANAINRRLNDIYSQFDVEKLSSIETFGKSNKKVFEKHSDAPMLTTNYGNIGLNNTLLKDNKALSRYVEEGEKSYQYVLENIDVLKGTQRELAEAYRMAGRQLVGNSVEDMITHEVGHHISYMSATNKQLSEISASADWKKYAQTLSGYSNHSFGEYVAESFNAYYNGEYDRIQPEIKTIFDSLRKNK